MSHDTLDADKAQLDKMRQRHQDLMAKISRKAEQIRQKERKARNRRLYDYGGLVELAALTDEDKGLVLGLLLDGARRIEIRDAIMRQWKRDGDRLLDQRAAERQVTNAKKRGQAGGPTATAAVADETHTSDVSVPATETETEARPASTL